MSSYNSRMPDLSRRRFLGTAALGTAGAIGALYGASSNELEVTTHGHPMALGAPPLRLALLTDMHSPHDYVEGKRLIAAVRAFKPDVIANVVGVGIPPLRDLLDKCLAQNIHFYV